MLLLMTGVEIVLCRKAWSEEGRSHIKCAEIARAAAERAAQLI